MAVDINNSLNGVYSFDYVAETVDRLNIEQPFQRKWKVLFFMMMSKVVSRKKSLHLFATKW